MEKKMDIIHLKKGDIIFRQGDTEKVLYKVLSGTVAIYSDYEGSRSMRLSTVEKDQCFGEMSLLEDCPRSATAVVDEDATLAAYEANMMSTFIYQNPGFSLQVMKDLSSRLRNSTKELEKMHGMLLKLSAEKDAGEDINEYLYLHTTYGSDGTPRFHMFPR